MAGEGAAEQTWTAAWAFALAVSLVATVASLNFSGIGPLGWYGMALFPCELCWYQRILMYPLPVVIAAGLWRRDRHLPFYVLPLSAAGALLAAYHVVLQLYPAMEAGQCFVGACSVVQYRFLGWFTIPQMSLAAFFLVTVAGAVAALSSPHDASG